MEADWEIEIGGAAPVIDAAWSGLIDLRAEPIRIREVCETTQLPGLAQALLQLNAPLSPVWTAKCDLWETTDFDADEMNADPADANQALACYIDLLPRSPRQWTSPEMAIDACKIWCSKLHSIPLANCRADFVIRRAWITSDRETVGITAYLTACSADAPAAQITLTAALGALASAVAPDSSTSAEPSK
ncbi:MAG: hypothetical protein ACLGSD_13905 [Acidobacteriota bacterium]